MNTTIDVKNSPLHWNNLTNPKTPLEEIFLSELKELGRHGHLETSEQHQFFEEIPNKREHTSKTSSTVDSSSNFPLQAHPVYYRSKAFVSQIAINPLVAAASPLLFLLEQIGHLKQMPDLNQLHDALMYELGVFEHQAQCYQYRPYVIFAAKYMICAWTDHIILTAAWDKTLAWEKIRLSDPQAEERDHSFYLLIDRCAKEPGIYIDLLEFFYLCLSLGFQINSSSDSQEANMFRLSKIRDYLFEVISKQRGNISKQLEIDFVIKKTVSTAFVRSLLKPILMLITTSVLIGGYFIFNKKLEIPSAEKNTAISVQPATL